MCIACRQMKDKKDLVRIVKNKENQIFVDNSFKANGRGAYLCKDINCFDKLKKSKALNRTFKCEIDEKILDNLLDIIKE